MTDANAYLSILLAGTSVVSFVSGGLFLWAGRKRNTAYTKEAQGTIISFQKDFRMTEKLTPIIEFTTQNGRSIRAKPATPFFLSSAELNSKKNVTVLYDPVYPHRFIIKTKPKPTVNMFRWLGLSSIGAGILIILAAFILEL